MEILPERVHEGLFGKLVLYPIGEKIGVQIHDDF